MEDTRLVVFKFLFLFLCVFFFFLLVFSILRGLSIISSVRYFFVEAYPFKSICQIKIFVTVYLPKECLLNKQTIFLCKVSETLRTFTLNQQKPSENTQNFLHHQNPMSPQHTTSHQMLPCFSALDFEHDFIIRKVELGKNGKNIAMAMNHKGIL